MHNSTVSGDEYLDEGDRHIGDLQFDEIILADPECEWEWGSPDV